MKVLGQGLDDALERQNNHDVDILKVLQCFFFFRFTIKTLDR